MHPMSLPTRSIWVKKSMNKATSRQKVEVLDSPPGRYNDLVHVQDGGAFGSVVDAILNMKNRPKIPSLLDELARRKEVIQEGEHEEAPLTDGCRGRRIPVESHLTLLRKQLLPVVKPHACHVRWMRGQVNRRASVVLSACSRLFMPSTPKTKPEQNPNQVGDDEDLEKLLGTARLLAEHQVEGNIGGSFSPGGVDASASAGAGAGVSTSHAHCDSGRGDEQSGGQGGFSHTIGSAGQSNHGREKGRENRHVAPAGEFDPRCDEFLELWTWDPAILCLQATELDRRLRKETGVTAESRARVEIFREKLRICEYMLEKSFTSDEIIQASSRAVAVRKTCCNPAGGKN